MHFLDTFRILQRKYRKIKNCTLGNIFFIFLLRYKEPPASHRTQNLKVVSMSFESLKVSLFNKTTFILVNLFPYCQWWHQLPVFSHFSNYAKIGRVPKMPFFFRYCLAHLIGVVSRYNNSILIKKNHLPLFSRLPRALTAEVWYLEKILKIFKFK